MPTVWSSFAAPSSTSMLEVRSSIRPATAAIVTGRRGISEPQTNSFEQQSMPDIVRVHVIVVIDQVDTHHAVGIRQRRPEIQGARTECRVYAIPLRDSRIPGSRITVGCL